jgi:hypothetical protein
MLFADVVPMHCHRLFQLMRMLVGDIRERNLRASVSRMAVGGRCGAFSFTRKHEVPATVLCLDSR